MLAIRLPSEIEARLAHLAQETGRTKTFYAREAILTHLEELEDIPCSRNAVHLPGKGDIHQHKVGQEFGRHDDRLLARCSLSGNHVLLSLEHRTDEIPDDLIVLDNQDTGSLRGHGRSVFQ